MKSSVPNSEQALWPLEAWRGLAAWLVVYAHVYPLAGVDWPLLRFSYTGVDLFFALSGFVFAPYFFDRQPALKAYAVRRLFRIYPAYVVALLVYSVLKWQTGGKLDYLWEHMLFAHLQSREMAFHYNPAFWSLPAEVEFYLALPLLTAWTRGNQRRVLLLLAAALILRLALGQASSPSGQGAAFIWLHHLPGMGVEFMLGVLAWRLADRVKGWRQRTVLVLCGLAGWLGLAALFAAWGDAGLNASLLRGQISWLAALCFAAMLAGTASAGAQAPPRLIWLAQWAGKLSYGTYLLHMAALYLVQPHVGAWGGTTAVGLICVMTLTGAWMLHRWWEEPWRRLGRRLARRLQEQPNQ